MLDLLSNPTNAIDSPDLGPPPIAHLDEGDPIKYDGNKNLSTSGEQIDAARDLNPALLANLETRRKRKSSSYRAESAISCLREDQTDKSEGLAKLLLGEQPLKSGAKRKFAAREDDSESEERVHIEKEGLSYSRTQAATELDAIHPLKRDLSKEEKSAEQNLSRVSRPIKPKEQERTKGPAIVATAGRSVLGPSKQKI